MAEYQTTKCALHLWIFHLSLSKLVYNFITKNLTLYKIISDFWEKKYYFFKVMWPSRIIYEFNIMKN